MKAYTSLEQSKKLAEMLPVESADMRYHTISHYNPYPCGEIVYTVEFGKTSDIDIPCWSLTALLNVLPSATLDSSDDHHYRLYCNEKFTDWYDNPIDCCIAMIDRLHDQMIDDFNNSNN